MRELDFNPASLGSARVYENRGRPEELGQDLEAVAGYQRVVSRRARRAKILALLAVLSGLAVLVTPAALKDQSALGPPWMFGLELLGCLAWFFASLGFYNRQARVMIREERLSAAREVFESARTEVEPGSMLALRFDLGPAASLEKRVSSREEDRETVEEFENPWLRLEGRLAGGAGFVLNIEELYEVRRRKRSGSSGEELRFQTTATKRVRARLSMEGEARAPELTVASREPFKKAVGFLGVVEGGEEGVVLTLTKDEPPFAFDFIDHQPVGLSAGLAARALLAAVRPA